METFHTGQRIPATRTYTFVGHMESNTCSLRQDEKKRYNWSLEKHFHLV